MEEFCRIERLSIEEFRARIAADETNPTPRRFMLSFAWFADWSTSRRFAAMLAIVLWILILLMLAATIASAAPPSCATPGYSGRNYDGRHTVNYEHVIRIDLKQVHNDVLWTVGPEVRDKAFAERVEKQVRENLAAKEAAPKSAAEKSILQGKRNLKLSCSSCHSPGTFAVTSDGAEPFYNDKGELKSLTGLERQAMYDAITKKRMPPPPAPPVDADDALDIKAFFDSQK